MIFMRFRGPQALNDTYEKHRGVALLWLTRSYLINARTSRKGRHLQDEAVESQPTHHFPYDSITAGLWFFCHKTIYEITSRRSPRDFAHYHPLPRILGLWITPFIGLGTRGGGQAHGNRTDNLKHKN